MIKIYLASKSPRRKEILQKFNIELFCVDSNLKEEHNSFETGEQTAMSLAFQKADNIIQNIEHEGFIIAADTILYHEGKVLGKPRSEDEARQILSDLSGKTHKVITGICLIEKSSNVKIVDYETTYVSFKKLNSDLIEKYLKTNEYKDKAGGYGIQGMGSLLVDKIDGCYFNVMGLPISKIESLLNDNFDVSLL